MKRLSIFAVLMIALLAFAGVASAAVQNTEDKIEVTEVEINGDEFEPNQGQSVKINVDRGEDVKVKVRLSAKDGEDFEGQVRAEIVGYEHADSEGDKIRSVTETFELEANETESITLNLQVPLRMDRDTTYLRVQVSDKSSSVYEELFTLNVKGVDDDDAIVVKDVFLTPENSIKAGRYLLAQIKAKNFGDQDYEDITYKFSIPALGLTDRDDANEIEEDRSRTSEDLIVQIPQCAEAGSYAWTATVEWDDGDHFATQEGVIQIEASETCKQSSGLSATDMTLLSVGATSATLEDGQVATYPVTITNQGAESQAYTITVDGAADFANVRVDPTNTAVLRAGETKTLYVYVTPLADATAGQRVFTATVSSGSEVLQQLALTAVLNGESTQAEGTDATEALKIGLVVLVVLFVILALIVGFNKLKGSDDDDDEDGQTYY